MMNLGEYSTTGESKTYNWNVNGLDAGSYKVEWNVAVLSDEHVPNVMNHLVQDSWTKTVEFSVTEVIPTLSVKRGNQLGYTFANTEAHTETFYYEGTLGKVVVRKQNVFAKFDKEANGVVVNIDETEKVIKVTFPQGLEAGIYRVTFSLNNDSSEDGDNVYYTFIVE